MIGRCFRSDRMSLRVVHLAGVGVADEEGGLSEGDREVEGHTGEEGEGEDIITPTIEKNPHEH